MVDKRISETIHVTQDDYIDSIVSLIPSTTTTIGIYGENYTSDVVKKLREKLTNVKSLKLNKSHEIHDRYIIKDSKYGKMFGTSFGGFGRKIFTALDLPEEDTQKILECISASKNMDAIP